MGLICAALAGGCAYQHTLRRAEAVFANGEYAGAAAILKDASPPGRDMLLHHLELGTFLHCAGDFAGSNESFLEASRLAREYDDRARVSARDAAAFAAALAINDNLLSYRGEPHERVLMHTMLAVNYLLLHDLENARVEILQGYQVQKEMRQDNEEAIDQTKAEAAKRSCDTGRINCEIDKVYAKQEKLLRSAGNVYQNAFTYYLSSVVYEMNGEISDAYIDAKTVYALNPNFLPVRRALARYARQLGAGSDLERWRAAFGGDAEARPPKGSGEVIVLYARGLAPEKEQVKLSLPIPIDNHIALLSIAFPVFALREESVAMLSVRDGCDRLGVTQPLMSVEATAVRNLWENTPAIAIRELIRASGKLVLQEQARKEYGPFAALAALLFTDITAQADLRSWQSLPAEFQAARLTVQAGKHDFTADLVSSCGSVLCSVPVCGVNVPEGGIAFVLLRSVGVHGTAYQVSFSKSIAN